MTLEELEVSLKLMDSTIYEPTALLLRDWQKLEALMKAILSLTEVVSLLNSRLDEIETRLSTSTPGSEKQSEKREPMRMQGRKMIYPPRY